MTRAIEPTIPLRLDDGTTVHVRRKSVQAIKDRITQNSRRELFKSPAVENFYFLKGRRNPGHEPIADSFEAVLDGLLARFDEPADEAGAGARARLAEIDGILKTDRARYFREKLDEEKLELLAQMEGQGQ